jgi:glycosyltransferase involved in cell wall biosynthesis
MLTDLAWAQAARTASERALDAPVDTSARPRAIIYSSTTAALLWRVPGAIRFDAPAAANRPGRHGLWQRPLEQRRLRQAPLLLPWSAQALEEAGVGAELAARALVVPVAVEPSGALGGERDIAAVTYAANPSKKGLDRVLAAWRELPAGGRGELLIAGLAPRELERALPGASAIAGVRALGALPRDDYRALLRRARAFVCAPRREDYGLAQLEALADGCMLVTTPAPGPYAALALARSLDQRLVGEDLARALRAALEDPLPGYAARAQAALSPYRLRALDRLVSEQLLARLLGQRAQL